MKACCCCLNSHTLKSIFFLRLSKCKLHGVACKVNERPKKHIRVLLIRFSAYKDRHDFDLNECK